jgi:small subunit ribosomal protein S6
LVLVVSPEGGEEGFPVTVERVHKFITDRGGTIHNVDAWGRRRLAYQIRRYNEGYYNITHFGIEPQEIRQLEASLDLADDVLRHLVVRLDELPPPAPVAAPAAVAAAPAEPTEPAEAAEE